MGLRGRGARKVGSQICEAATAPWQAPRLSRAQRIIKFIESLPVTKGHLAGQSMKLLPEQKRFIREVYGSRGVKLAVLSAPRGNGKTGLLAGLTLAHLLGPEAIPRGETYSAAIDRGQAAILYREMAAIIEAVPEFDARCNCVKHFKRIEVLSGQGAGSTYEALSNDARRGHGLAPSFWCFDELGQVKDRELLDALTTAMGKQPGALGIVISTQSADDEHPLSQLIDDGLNGLDASVYVQLHAAAEDADPLDPKTWASCNFALGKFLDRKDFEAQAKRAARVPAFMSAFKNLRLNMRVHADERLIARDDWLACGGEIDLEALRGRRCWGGLDLSSTTDLTALALVFEGDPMPVLAWHWMPAGRIDELSHEDHRTYRVWRDQGLIETPAGRAIDKAAVALRLAEIASQYDVQSIGFDEWRFADLQKILTDEGITLPMKAMRQGFKTMAGCVDALERAVVDRKILHNGNQVLTMCISNATVETDPTGSRKLSKKRSRSRIDSAVCLAMALGLQATEPGARIYDFSLPGVLVV
jgi:phage terminase large subunit-like protein